MVMMNDDDGDGDDQSEVEPTCNSSNFLKKSFCLFFRCLAVSAPYTLFIRLYVSTCNK